MVERFPVPDRLLVMAAADKTRPDLKWVGFLIDTDQIHFGSTVVEVIVSALVTLDALFELKEECPHAAFFQDAESKTRQESETARPGNPEILEFATCLRAGIPLAEMSPQPEDPPITEVMVFDLNCLDISEVPSSTAETSFLDLQLMAQMPSPL